MSSSSGEELPKTAIEDYVRQRMQAIAAAGQSHFPRTALEIAEERAREQGAWNTAQAEEAARVQVGEAAMREYARREGVSRRLQGQLEQTDIRLDPDINRIAELFYTALMQRIYFEFGHTNPDWATLGGEKKLWLEATQIVLEELSKSPVASKELAAIVNKRIITE